MLVENLPGGLKDKVVQEARRFFQEEGQSPSEIEAGIEILLSSDTEELGPLFYMVPAIAHLLCYRNE